TLLLILKSKNNSGTTNDDMTHEDREFLKSLGDVPLVSPDKRNQTALHYAGIYGSSGDVLDALIKENLKLEVKNDLGYTALHCAAHSGNKTGLEKLLQAGADWKVSGQLPRGAKAIHLAAAQGHWEV